MFSLDSVSGRIGPFWWLNGCMSKTELRNATYMGSVHQVWREGACGWGEPVGKKFHWKIIK